MFHSNSQYSRSYLQKSQIAEPWCQAELEKAIESVERDTDKLRRQKEPLEKKMMDKQQVANQLKQKRDEQKNVQETFTEKYDRAVQELDNMRAEIESIKENSKVCNF